MLSSAHDTPDIVTAPRALPGIGHVLPLVRDPLGFLSSLPAHGDLVRLRLGATEVVLVCDPGLAWDVLRNDRVFDKEGPTYEVARQALRNGIATCPHRDHRRHRRLCQPAFHPDRFPGYEEIMSRHIGDVVTTWKAGQILHVPAEIRKITSRSAIDTMFHSAVPSPTADLITHDVVTLLKGLYWRSVMPPLFCRMPTPGNRRFFQARDHLRRVVENVINERRAEGKDRGDLLSALLAVYLGGEEDDLEIRDHIMTFFVGGTESSSVTLSWALYFLARHPRIRARLQEEVDAVVGDNLTAVTSHLPYLDLTQRVLTETMRIYPPGWLFSRVVTADTRLGRVVKVLVIATR
ncbi:cytochrome P450 [Streptomyces sp. NPDC007205]|uniref:cytochrome P450 n=1 Tax=Streptomyces sp. NPDC007205 TaxID=3154316 RepID=UPI0033F7D74A